MSEIKEASPSGTKIPELTPEELAEFWEGQRLAVWGTIIPKEED